MNEAVEPIRSLEAAYYTDPQYFGQELLGVFSRCWQYAGHRSALQKPGDYFAFEIARQRLFCVLDQAGNIKTFYNVCQHRAHELVSGQGHAKQLVCPYHAWAYDLSGQLITGPNLNAVPGLDKSKICLSSVRTEEFCGFIFVNLDPDAEPMDVWYPGVREQMREFVPHIDSLQPIKTVTIPEKCNWKVSVENYSECYHCKINHPTFATGVIKPQTYDIQPQGYCLRHTTECQNLNRMTYPIDLDANEHAGDYSSWFLWPTFSFQVYPGNVLNTYQWQAHDHENCTVYRHWYTIDGQLSDVIDKLADQDRATTVEEDIGLVEAVQRGLSSRGYVPGPLVLDPKCGVNSEHSIAALQQWMRAGTDLNHQYHPTNN